MHHALPACCSLVANRSELVLSEVNPPLSCSAPPGQEKERKKLELAVHGRPGTREETT